MFETHELEVKTTPEHNQSIISSNLPVCLITTCISTIISADMLSFFSVIILFLKMCGIWWHDEALTSHTVTHLLNTSPLLKADFNLALQLNNSNKALSSCILLLLIFLKASVQRLWNCVHLQSVREGCEKAKRFNPLFSDETFSLRAEHPVFLQCSLYQTRRKEEWIWHRKVPGSLTVAHLCLSKQPEWAWTEDKHHWLPNYL